MDYKQGKDPFSDAMVRQVKCQVAGYNAGGIDEFGELISGPYISDTDCTTVAERSADMKDHVYQAQTLAKELADTEVKRTEAKKSAASDFFASASVLLTFVSAISFASM